jgi:hypothetical protein
MAPHVAVLRKPRRFVRQLMFVFLSIPDILDGLGSQTLSQLGQIQALGFDRDPGRIEGPCGQVRLRVKRSRGPLAVADTPNRPIHRPRRLLDNIILGCAVPGHRPARPMPQRTSSRSPGATMMMVWLRICNQWHLIDSGLTSIGKLEENLNLSGGVMGLGAGGSGLESDVSSLQIAIRHTGYSSIFRPPYSSKNRSLSLFTPANRRHFPAQKCGPVPRISKWKVKHAA